MNCPLTVKKIFFQLTNGDVQKANFDGQEGISQPDVVKTQKQSGSSFGGLILHLQMELKISSIIKANLS